MFACMQDVVSGFLLRWYAAAFDESGHTADEDGPGEYVLLTPVFNDEFFLP